jgi:hypothetical protein
MARSLTVKTATETRWASTTLQDDSTLVVSLLANKTYLLDVGIYAHGYSGIGVRLGVQFTGTLAYGHSHTLWAASTYGHPTTGQAGSYASVRQAGELTDGTSYYSQQGTGSPGDRGHYRAWILLRTTSAGNFAVRWAPGGVTAEGTGSRVFPGSYIAYEALEDSASTLFAVRSTDYSRASSGYALVVEVRPRWNLLMHGRSTYRRRRRWRCRETLPREDLHAEWHSLGNIPAYNQHRAVKCGYNPQLHWNCNIFRHRDSAHWWHGWSARRDLYRRPAYCSSG